METFGEYDPATPLAERYCSRISSQEYEEQGCRETYAALQNLLGYMDSNPELFRKILARKKQEETENEGIFSYLKCKVLERIRGPNFMLEEVTEGESEDKLNQMKSEMCEVFNYAQDTKSSPVAKRFSKRLASKRSNQANKSQRVTPKRTKGPAPPPPPPPPPPYPPPGSHENETTPARESVLGITPSPRKPLRTTSASRLGRGSDGCSNKKKESKREPVGGGGTNQTAPPSCPPPPPPPPSTAPPKLPTNSPSKSIKRPLQERTNTIATPTAPSPAKKTPLKSDPRLSQLKRVGSTTSIDSISSIHDELKTFDKGKLKAVTTGSPGRTPKKRVPCKPQRTGIPGHLSVDSFNMKILDKFKNVHSPGQQYGSPNSSCNSTGAFDTSDFTP